MISPQDLLTQALLWSRNERADMARELFFSLESDPVRNDRMSARHQELLSQALLWSFDERAIVAQELSLSLESPTFQADYESAWQKELAERVRRLDEGQTQTFDWREAHAEIRRHLRERKS